MGEIIKKRLLQKSFSSIEQEALLNLFIAANYLKSKIDSICIEYNITLSQFNVLRILKGTYPDGYSRNDIIRRMIEPSPDVTRLIDRLINEGLVERYNSDKDRRLSLARITKKGIDVLKKINPRIDEFLFEYSKTLNRSEKETLSEICERLYAEQVEN
jgi:DNA-binding MarR family transcriptional regulator